MGFKHDDSCLAKAADDEPIFVILGRDRAARAAVAAWAQERLRLGLNVAGDEQLVEAAEHTRAMVTYGESRAAARAVLEQSVSFATTIDGTAEVEVLDDPGRIIAGEEHKGLDGGAR